MQAEITFPFLMYLLLQISYVEVFLEQGVGFCVPPGCAPLCPRGTIDTGNLIMLSLKHDQKVLNAISS